MLKTTWPWLTWLVQAQKVKIWPFAVTEAWSIRWWSNQTEGRTGRQEEENRRGAISNTFDMNSNVINGRVYLMWETGQSGMFYFVKSQLEIKLLLLMENLLCYRIAQYCFIYWACLFTEPRTWTFTSGFLRSSFVGLCLGSACTNFLNTGVHVFCGFQWRLTHTKLNQQSLANQSLRWTTRLFCVCFFMVLVIEPKAT